MNAENNCVNMDVDRIGMNSKNRPKESHPKTYSYQKPKSTKVTMPKIQNKSAQTKERNPKPPTQKQPLKILRE